MKRIYLLCITVIGLFLYSTANPVDQQTAQSVAAKFMGTSDVQLVFTYRTDKSAAAFYVFNTEDGFVIVSADDCETPIIGYSHEGRFDLNEVPVQMEAYLQDFVERIQYGIKNHIVADETTAKQWELVKTVGRLNERKDSKAVGPLLTEMWEQGCHYNELCPTFSKVPCGHAEVGCVAVAMGQIMHYWRYPETGWGSHSYNNAGVQLSADFGNTVYDWDHMPDSLTDDSSDAEIEAVATLLFHCGVSVNMKYTTNGSGADSGDVPDALIKHFKYSSSLHIEKHSDHNDAEWILMLKSCLNLQRPVYYGGKGSQGSHAFVCDGYDGNDLLHFNWGWGRANGYFALGNLNPIGYSFNEKNFAILDITPNLNLFQVSASVIPPNGGHIHGLGGYHIHEQCNLTAVPEGDYDFYYWRKDREIVSLDSIYSMEVTDDINGIEALFVLRPATSITASLNADSGMLSNPIVNFSYEEEGGLAFPLMKQFVIEKGEGVISDEEFIYVFHNWNAAGQKFTKYTMEGEFVENFNVTSCNYIICATYDGTYFYACARDQRTLYTLDLKNQQLISYTTLPFIINAIAYDSITDNFWVANSAYSNTRKIYLLDRSGHIIKAGPDLPAAIISAGMTNGTDHNRHLLASTHDASIYDYNINQNMLDTFNITNLGFGSSHSIISTGKYEGENAVFVCNKYGHTVKIFGIRDVYSKVMYYRLYRKDNLGNEVMLADEFTKTSFIDTTWNEARPGTYQFGVSSVFFNGNESKVIWSDAIVKMNHCIDENEDSHPTDPSVQKVIEDGRIVIIKDGKRYSLSGQTLNQ